MPRAESSYRRNLLLSCLVPAALGLGTGAIAQTAPPNAPADCPIGVAAAGARPWLDANRTPDCRARLVVAQLKTLDQKLAFLTRDLGEAKGPARALYEKLGLRVPNGADGPAGIRTFDPDEKVTTFPSPLTVGASFDRAVAGRYGTLLGAEFRRSGRADMLGPSMDVARNWQSGRVTESFGEDPYLAAALVVPEVRGIQSNHVVSMGKHYAVYLQEQNRTGGSPLGRRPAVNFAPSEKALREVYLAPFRAAVEDGRIGNMMCSFARINGVPACENAHILGILKDEWGFAGLVGPDAPDAQRSIVKAVLAGLDMGILESRRGAAAGPTDYFDGESLRRAVLAGTVPIARIDDMVMRHVHAGFATGMYDAPVPAATKAISTPETRAELADIVAAGAVLLKNDGGILPFGADVKSIAVIGAQAGDKATIQQRGSAFAGGSIRDPAFPAIARRAGGAVSVGYAAGGRDLAPLDPVPAAMLRTPDGRAGLRAEYFANPNLDFSGRPVATRVEAGVLMDAVPAIAGLPKDRLWSARWTGVFTPTETGVQRFTLDASGSVRLFVDDREYGRFDDADLSDIAYANVPMTKGRPVRLRVEYAPRAAFFDKAVKDPTGRIYDVPMFGVNIRLGWSAPDTLMAQAVAAARQADVAVVFVGQRIGEGMDRRTLALPSDQDALVRAVAKANRRTVVVLNTGGPVSMPWLPDVAGVLETWLPGSVQGTATARLLFGDADPGGRLPVTFPADERQGPSATADAFPGVRDATGALSHASLAEGVAIGYRWYDSREQTPLFPFGYGLSYTDFALSDVAVRPAGTYATVTARLRNTGARAGSQVVQVYLGFPAEAHEPPRLLRGFAKASLQPGESRTVAVCLPPQAFEFWDERVGGWRTSAAPYRLMVGTSSRDIRDSRTITLPARSGAGARECTATAG